MRCATTYYYTTSWHYEEIKSSVASFLPIKLHKPTIANDPTHCACAHDTSIRPIQIEVTLLLQICNQIWSSASGIRPIPEAEMSNQPINTPGLKILWLLAHGQRRISGDFRLGQPRVVYI